VCSRSEEGVETLEGGCFLPGRCQGLALPKRFGWEPCIVGWKTAVFGWVFGYGVAVRRRVPDVGARWRRSRAKMGAERLRPGVYRDSDSLRRGQSEPNDEDR
jgi:hypothetical protein